MDLVSPVTGHSLVKLIRELDVVYIIELYQKAFLIDVTKYFKGINTISLFECVDTGYRFYYPVIIAGDSNFYEILQQISWYYSEGKDEHAFALAAITPEQKVLEVGCGNGIFLSMLQKKGVEAVGLDFNPKAISQAQAKGLIVFNEAIEAHAETHEGVYDVVASFQVLEHVAGVKFFLDSCLRCLKPNGVLIISVPNNEAPFHKHFDDPLNMPPHHMGLWGINSLIALQAHFPVILERLQTDTSTPPEWVHQQAMKAVEESLKPKYGVFATIMCNLAKKFIQRGAESMIEHMPGQTVTAYYRKR